MPVVAKETDERADVDAILAAVTARTKIVFLANPNNPTGTYVPFEEVRRLHAALPKHVLLVLDAAYAEYVRRNDYESGIELVSSSENVVMTRTFSKVHGLGGVAHRLDVCAGAHRRCDEPHARPVQRQCRGDRGRHGGDRATARMSRGASPTTTMAALAHRRADEARPEGHAERRQFRAHPFPRERAGTRPPRPTRISPRRATSCGASPATAFPTRCA